MSESTPFYGTPQQLESCRAELAERLREMAAAVEQMPTDRLAEIYYDFDRALDQHSRSLGLKPPQRVVKWSEARRRRPAVNVEERIARFLEEQDGAAFCDDCLPKRVGLKNRHQARNATSALGAAANFARRRGACSACGAEKTVTRAV